MNQSKVYYGAITEAYARSHWLISEEHKTDVMPYNLVDLYKCFGERCCRHLRVDTEFRANELHRKYVAATETSVTIGRAVSYLGQCSN
jgi:hypothetical protein